MIKEKCLEELHRSKGLWQCYIRLILQKTRWYSRSILWSWLTNIPN